MQTLSRTEFLRYCLSAGALVALTPLSTLAHAAPDEFYDSVVAANNAEVAQLLQTLATPLTDVRRRLGFDLANLAAAYSEPTSRYYQQADLVPAMEKVMRFLVQAQRPDGTLDIANLASPPDTGFILEALCTAGTILLANPAPALAEVKALHKTFVVKAGEALRTGGVHTPNHRWVISAALARMNALYPNPAYVRRINEWLAEGVFCDSDGNYLERSMNYAAVNDRTLTAIGQLQRRPDLLDKVRRNLRLVYHHMEPDGELVTVDSRRQDQYAPVNILLFYLDYHFYAIHDNNPEWAALTQFIRTVPGFDKQVRRDLLAAFLEEPIFKKPLPAPKAPSVNYRQFFKHTSLVRIRRGTTTTTLFGGNDLPLTIASGRSNSPNFFAFRKGAAILNYMRLSTDFFNTGYFHSEGITPDGEAYVLHRQQTSPYYQPLPAKYRKADGNYALTPSTDGRFWNKMDFAHRPQSNLNTLKTTIRATEQNGQNTLMFTIAGVTGIHVTLELCFRAGGQVSGLTAVGGSTDNYFLPEGTGEYRMGDDTIQFGPGLYKHDKITNLGGEPYSSHFGSLRTEGIHVYLTGVTPLTYTLKIG
ncbi:hypothetical protein CLV58_1521 [Spirosoma oryzae]|uniref:Heparinase II/III-like protein n=1 Tax=Spirosoma oryzae TaxID=1469603 RepID=A0A2T0RJI9_9BACT|nr:hypothetical protein [Spirosoma oryzae]PRY21282.1 hypothetical protein CLV58_1521 [Spirosoma oryzae]